MKTLAIVMMLLAGLVLSGCSLVQSPVCGLLFTQTKGPVSGVDNSVNPTRTGVAECTGVLGFAFNDASISKAMDQGDIDKIHHIDHESLSVLGIYTNYKIIVYGE